MGLMDSARRKAQDVLKNNPDKVEQVSDRVIGKLGDAVDSRTGGKFSDKVDRAQQAADDRVGQ